jgi:hypothetical protein
LHPLYRGVYAAGHSIVSLEGRWIAAVLACGEGAALSHRDAAAGWGIRRSASALIDVTIPTRNGRQPRDGIRLHRVALPEEDVTVRDGVPVTTLARTLLDLAAVVPVRAVRQAFTRPSASGCSTSKR